MLNLNDLKDRFDWSYMQARDRVKWLQDNFSGEVKVGKNQKYLITDNGLSILDRVHQLEEQDNLALSAALNQVKEEMGESQVKDSSEEDNKENLNQSNSVQSSTKHPQNEIQSNQKYVERLERENEFLKEQLRAKDQQIQQLLPGKVEKKSPVQRVWEWLGL